MYYPRKTASGNSFVSIFIGFEREIGFMITTYLQVYQYSIITKCTNTHMIFLIYDFENELRSNYFSTDISTVSYVIPNPTYRYRRLWKQVICHYINLIHECIALSCSNHAYYDSLWLNQWFILDSWELWHVCWFLQACWQLLKKIYQKRHILRYAKTQKGINDNMAFN